MPGKCAQALASIRKKEGRERKLVKKSWQTLAELHGPYSVRDCLLSDF